MRFLFDTNVWVSIFRGTSRELRQRWEGVSPDTVFLSSPTLAELYAGALKSQRIQENMALISTILQQHDCLYFGVPEALRFAELRLRAESAGFQPGVMDLQIAAISHVHDLTIVTHDVSDFSRIPGIQFEDWQGTLSTGST